MLPLMNTSSVPDSSCTERFYPPAPLRSSDLLILEFLLYNKYFCIF